MAENTEVPLVRGRKYIIIAPKIYPFMENISMNSEARGYEVDDWKKYVSWSHTETQWLSNYTHNIQALGVGMVLIIKKNQGNITDRV